MLRHPCRSPKPLFLHCITSALAPRKHRFRGGTPHVIRPSHVRYPPEPRPLSSRPTTVVRPAHDREQPTQAPLSHRPDTSLAPPNRRSRIAEVPPAPRKGNSSIFQFFHLSVVQCFRLPLFQYFHSSIFTSLYIIRCVLSLCLTQINSGGKTRIFVKKLARKFGGNRETHYLCTRFSGTPPVKFRGWTNKRPNGSSLNGLDKTE